MDKMDGRQRCIVFWMILVGSVVASGVQGQRQRTLDNGPLSGPTDKGGSNSTSNIRISVSPQPRQLGGFFPNPNTPGGEGIIWNGGESPWLPQGVNNDNQVDIRFCRRPRGQFPHPVYCDRFYNCWDGAVFVQSCPAGLMFQNDPNRPYCDYPASVRCEGRRAYSSTNSVCPQSSGIFPHPNDCRLFVSCVGGKAFVQTCPRPLLFSPQFQICDYSYNVQCTGSRPEVTPEVTVPDRWPPVGNNWWPGQPGSIGYPGQPGVGVMPGQTGSGSWPGLGPGVHPFPVYGRNQKPNSEPNLDERENSLQNN